MTPEAAAAMYRRQIGRHGQIVTLERAADPGDDVPIASVNVRARLFDFAPSGIESGLQQDDRRVVFLAEDIEDFPLPIREREDDYIVIGDARFAIEAVDDRTRSVGGVLIAYDLRVRGGSR